MLLLLWAALFDCADGIIARRLLRRSDHYRRFGVQLDSLVDIVCCCVAPAILAISYSSLDSWSLPPSFALVCAGALRLSFYNSFSASERSVHEGVPVDVNVVMFAAIFLADGYVSRNTLTVGLWITMYALAAANVAPVRVGKLGSWWAAALFCFIIIMSILYAQRLGLAI